ncbi:hypothetical protein JCM1841_000945, partial [Sporobolomyces salmonicolor]
QHRRTIVLALNDPSRELDFTSKALSLDSKNYHTWAYRQWVLFHFFGDLSLAPEDRASLSEEDKNKRKGVWQGELEYVDKLLTEDIRNNSAWNHRFFVCFESGQMGPEEVGESEIQYAKGKLAISPNNPSAWNYLRGVLTRLSLPLTTAIPFATPLALNTPLSMPPNEPAVSEKAELPAWLAIEFLADAKAEEALKEEEEGSRTTKGQEAAVLFTSLIEFDPIRRYYWTFRAQEAVSVA